jgi:hypothetical protein
MQAKDQRNRAAPVFLHGPLVTCETPANAFVSMYLEFLMGYGRGAGKLPSVTP